MPEYKFEHLYKTDGAEKTCEELIAEDVQETVEALEKQGKSRHAEDIYEAIEQRVSLEDIRKVLKQLNRCDNCGCRLFTPDPLHICRSRK